jgi:general secretion pathway protein B
MSYILDALKKAESDRLSGAAPIIGAPVERFLAPEAPRRKRWLWAAIPLTAVAVAVLVWFTAGREQEAAQPSTITAQIDPPPAIPAPEPSPPPQRATPVVAVPQAPAPAKNPAAPERATPTKPVEKKADPARSEARPVPEQKAATAITRPAPKTSVPERRPAPQPQPAPIQEALPFLHELAPHVQREIPKFSIDGYLYSGNKADRSLLINRRLLHEGDQIASGLVIEEMRPQEMVLNYRGTRYRSNY